MLKNYFFSVKNFLVVIIFSITTNWLSAQNVVWEKNYGGSGSEQLYSVQKTSDGGYVMVGNTTSSASGDVTGASKGAFDVWIVKLDASGNIAWQKNYGGSGSEYGMGVKQTSDGGYIVMAYTPSSASGDFTGTSKGGNDIWILKLDPSGNIVWQKNYGGSGADNTNSNAILQTTDGGYVFVSQSASSASGDFTGTSKGGQDLWVVKLNTTGDIQWQKNYGGSGSEFISHLIQTTDGGFMVGGYTGSSASGDVSGVSKGNNDIWLLKLDGSGNLTWEKNYGGSGVDNLRYIQQTQDDGYIFTGVTQSSASGDVTEVSKGLNDAWIVKLSSVGDIVWQKKIGGSGDDVGYSIQLEADGGYILGGYTASSANGDITRASKGSNDFWLVKLDSVGTIKWENNFGGAGSEIGCFVDQTSNGFYTLFGYSASSASGDFSATSKGSNDFWVLKLGVSSLSTLSFEQQKANIYPNPAKDFVTISNVAKGTEVNLYDVTGKLLYSTKALSSSLTINTSSYQNGVYILKVGGQTNKLLISK